MRISSTLQLKFDLGLILNADAFQEALAAIAPDGTATLERFIAWWLLGDRGSLVTPLARKVHSTQRTYPARHHFWLSPSFIYRCVIFSHSLYIICLCVLFSYRHRTREAIVRFHRAALCPLILARWRKKRCLLWMLSEPK